ncbi:MAG: type II toxin-antitoxin system RelE/ParE family toxin [Candidatus Binatia bacterium]
MPKVRIHFHPAAAAEVEAAVRWYAERSPLAARALATEVNACVERVREAPERWPRYVHSTRRYLFPHFPFSLVYRVHNGEI